MKDHNHQSLNSSTFYIPPHQRLKSVIVSSSISNTSSQTSIQSSSTPSIEFNGKQNHNNFTSKPRNTSNSSSLPPSLPQYKQQPLQQQQQQQNNLLEYNHTSELIDLWDEEPDFHVNTSSSLMEISNFEGLDEWKRKLTLLIRNKNEQEVVSKDKRDRINFEQIANLATKMGLYSHLYARVFVISKVPLPNYRFDLDDKRPQREVVLQFGLQRRVETLLREYISKEPMRGTLSDGFSSRSSSTGSLSGYDGFFEQQEPRTSAVMEKILRRRSLQLLDQQQAWKESEEGEKMQRFRKSLPSYKERDALLKTISRNQVVVITGETGCGKTTQIPQYILEAEIEAGCGSNCRIICTQPRRISAMAVSERVAAERGENLGESVGYRVRLEGIKGRDTRLLFCTTGILLRRLLVDRNLKGVSHVIVDEIHERGMNEDFLLIVLKELLPRRPELRLILMSATLNADQFSSYFGGVPMVHIPGFTYPVRTYFLEDILEMTGYRLTPSNQTDDYGQDKSWKKQTLRKRKSQIAFVVEDALEVANLKEYSSQTQNSLSCWNPDSIGFNLIENVLCHLCNNEKPGAVLVFMTGWDDINSLKDQLQAHPLLGDPSRVLLLVCHGSMASSEQRLIFDKPEDGVRKIVLSTNIAETSITIDDVVFVIDCGKAKETSYDALNNTPCLLPSWISKAAAGQRRGRAGRVQPGECFCLYPKCVYDAFADNQLPELLRTPLQSICLQIKSLKLGSISDFLSRALQSPKLLSVQNAIEYLKIIGALDEEEKLTILGRHLSMLPVEPKLGKMLIMGAIFNCLDPILTVVAGLSVRDPFLMPIDKKDLAEQAKSQFAARDYSDHLAIIRAYEGWKDAEREQSGYDYCWKNFLSAPTLKAIDSLRKEFFSLLKDIGLVDDDPNVYNGWSNDGDLIRAVICTGLYPGICSVVNKETSISLKTMEDGRVLLYSNSVNGRESNIPYPWLVFNEKIKVNSVFLRDSTAISDSVLLLFGGKFSCGEVDGHLKMLGGYLEFFMKPSLAETYMNLKRELEQLIQSKLLNPKMNIQTHGELLSAVQLLISEDQCDGKFVFGHQVLAPSKVTAASVVIAPSPAGVISRNGSGPGGDNSKSQLQTLVTRAGHEAPTYKTEQVRNNQFQATVFFNGMQFVGQPCSNKKLAEKDAAAEALQWLTSRLQAGPVDIDRMSLMLKQKRKLHH
ncbi:Dexh-box atp-dependent rna helicase dexh3 [Thalictrum thalictroides]|uniref:RNA helicase n=1 Tax=Thalictrum thalictroides TaxID=46969 RepID=A0A7J6W3P1_THATH|nr:Dexh-box atp-dependent rna helicase dexh3 [Thalictrum thalictroides]